jgi:chromosome segregation ATPase
MKPHVPCLLIIILSSACMTGCVAPTGRWQDDSIGFRPELAERELAPKRRELAETQQGAAAEQFRQATLRRQMNQTRGDIASKQRRIEELRKEKAAAESELAQVEADLRLAQADADKTQALVSRRNSLRSEINRLDTLLADILELR